MEQRSKSDIVNEFLPLLRRYEKDDALSIAEVAEEPGSQLGDNYMSRVTRTKIIGKHGDGRRYEKNFMTKHFPVKTAITEHARTDELFFNEMQAYNKILPQLGNFGPPCIFADGQKIMMEDLKDYGFTLANRRDLLNSEHTAWTLQKLANLHASSLSWKLKKPEEFERCTSPLKEAFFPRDGKPALGLFINMSMRTAIKHLETIKPLTEDIAKAIKMLEKYEFKLLDKLQDLFGRPKEKYNVISHGDVWVNNMLFKYDANGRIVDHKFVDYQIMRHSSPAVDFHYFVYSSVASDLIETRYDELVKIYYNAFQSDLEKYNVPAKIRDDLSMDWFKNELRLYSPNGLSSAVGLVHAVLADEADVDNFQKMESVNFEDIVKNQDFILINPKKAERLRVIITHYMHRYAPNGEIN